MNADGARKLLERLNDAAAAGNCRVCMFILERRFSEDFGRRVYKKNECCFRESESERRVNCK